MFIKKESAAISAPHIIKAVRLKNFEHMYQLQAFNVPLFHCTRTCFVRI